MLEADEVFKESPMGSKSIEACLLGAPNAGKSSLLNLIVGSNVSAVSDKYNTTDAPTKGIFTHFDRRTQVVFLDTPGVTKMNNSMRSNLLVSKAWDLIPSQDLAIFVMDSVRRLSMDIKGAVMRLNNTKVDPSERKINDSIKEGTFS
jgi:GTPase